MYRGSRKHILDWTSMSCEASAASLTALLTAHRAFETIVHTAPGIAANVRRRDETTQWTPHTAAARSMDAEQSNTPEPGAVNLAVRAVGQRRRTQSRLATQAGGRSGGRAIWGCKAGWRLQGRFLTQHFRCRARFRENQSERIRR